MSEASEPRTKISAGAQVVVCAEILGSNDVIMHPRGAVGVVTRTPAGAEVHYLIRFPDGFEASLERIQFEDNAAQSCYWELKKFLTMALKANPNILESLYSPLVLKATPLGEGLLALCESFLSQTIFQTFNGYAMSQFKKIEQDRRNHDDIRWKHAMHLLRLLFTGAATLREGWVPVRVGTHREKLLAIKRGEISWSDVDAWRKGIRRRLHTLDTHRPKSGDCGTGRG